MKKMKKIVCLTALLTLGVVGLMGCETATTPSIDNTETIDTSLITLADFENESGTVFLGDKYSLPNAIVQDKDGKEYSVAYSITTQSGKTVGAVNGAFWVDFYESYSILCSVELSETDVRTRTISLTVKDNLAPTLDFSAFQDGATGVEYTLPTITVTDNSGESIQPNAKLYKLNGDTRGEEISVNAGKFTPSQSGYYLYEATAVDSSGNRATETEMPNGEQSRPRRHACTLCSLNV